MLHVNQRRPLLGDAAQEDASPSTPQSQATGGARPRPVIDVARAVAELVPYEAVTSQAAASGTREDVFKLDWNESTIPPSPRVTEALVAHLTDHGRGLNWYPELGSQRLVEALQRYTGLDAEHLMVTNGSDDALHLICATFLDPGDEVVVPVPTYNHFIVFAQSRGAHIRRVQGASPFSRNLDHIRAALSGDTRLLYLVSPNNPTGVVYRPEDVAALCEDFPHCLIVLDEAYFEFSQISGIDLVRRFPNLVVTRTFSKAFGLAGLRVGYLAAAPSVLAGLARLYNPKSVNSLAQIGATAALDDLPYLQDFLDQVLKAKAMLADFFLERGVEAYPTPANFVLIRVPDAAATLAALERRGVFVRDRSSYPGLHGCLRMSVGTLDQTRALIERLREVF